MNYNIQWINLDNVEKFMDEILVNLKNCIIDVIYKLCFIWSFHESTIIGFI